ncbi:hypothetical protein [Yinghuangia soli]|uniref:Uncharacterized protein n=1 Tax=Yinghuangia soli TaxID=2908204 RepID=A0AA41PZY3_9ACTN|nr:hypothetical protein [Yinghuangia soli]MCF2529013.1 hypothetical protein [Yinghuangia soli]
MGTGKRPLGAAAGGLAAVAVVAVAAYAVAGVAEREMGKESVEDALYRCDPVRTDAAALSARFPELGRLASASWCVQALGSPEYGSLRSPDREDLVYYAVARVPASALPGTPGAWHAAPDAPADLPAALRALLPASAASWLRNSGGAYADPATGTVVIAGLVPADPDAPPAPLPSPRTPAGPLSR